MSGQQFQQNSTQQQPQQQQHRYHNNNKSGSTNSNNTTTNSSTASNSTTPAATATGITSFDYSEAPPGATTRTTPDSGLGTDDQAKQAQQQQQHSQPTQQQASSQQQHRAPPGFNSNRYYPQGAMRPPNGMVYYSVPQYQQQDGYDAPQNSYGGPPGYDNGGNRSYRFSESNGYVPEENGNGSNNGFVIHGPNDGFDGRPQYNNHHQQHQQQQQHPQPHQIVANNGYGNDVERFGGYQGQPQAQYYTGSAVIHPSQHGYSAPPVPAHFRGGQQPPPPPPPPQMVSMMQPSAQQAAVMYPQPQMYMPAMYLPMPAPVVVRQAPASTAPNSTVDSKNTNKAKRNSQLLEEEPTSPSAAPSQHAPPPHVQTQPQQQQQPSEFGPNAYWNRPVSAPMMGYPATSYSPHQQQQMEMHHQQQQQQAQMQHHMQFQQMNTYGVPPGAPPPHAAAMMQQQHHQHMSQTGAYHQFVPIPPQSQQPQRRPGQVEPLMGGPPAFISGSPGRGGYQGGGGQMHSQHPQHMNANANPMQQPMGYFQVPATSGGPPRGGRGGRGRGGGHFHSRQNSNQSYHSSASYSTPRGAYDQNSHMYHQSPPMEQQTHEEEVAGLSNRIEHLQPVSASSRAGSPSKQMLQLVESKVESPEPEDIGGGFATAQVLDNVKKSGKKNRKEQKQKEQQKLTEEPKGEPVKADEVVKKDEEVEAKVVEKEAEEEEESSKEVEDKSENHCYHCAYYNKPTEEISSHNIRKPNGDLWCEDLQKQKCQHCEATGEKGHHHLICPKKKEEEKAEKSSLKTHNPPDAPALQESDKEPLASPREDEDDEDDAELNKKPSQHQKSRQNSETSRGGGRYHQYDKNYYNNNGGGRGRGRGSGGRGGYAPRGNVRGNFEFSE